MVNNVLTEEFYLAKAVRPAEEWIALRERTDLPQSELGMVYMLPLGLKPLHPLPLEIIAMAVHLVEADKPS